jgi:hypothetical protein
MLLSTSITNATGTIWISTSISSGVSINMNTGNIMIFNTRLDTLLDKITVTLQTITVTLLGMTINNITGSIINITGSI